MQIPLADAIFALSRLSWGVRPATPPNARTRHNGIAGESLEDLASLLAGRLHSEQEHLLLVSIVPVPPTRARPPVIRAWPSGGGKAVRTDEPLLIGTRGGHLEPAIWHLAAVPTPIFGGLGRAFLQLGLQMTPEGD